MVASFAHPVAMVSHRRPNRDRSAPFEVDRYTNILPNRSCPPKSRDRFAARSHSSAASPLRWVPSRLPPKGWPRHSRMKTQRKRCSPRPQRGTHFRSLATPPTRIEQPDPRVPQRVTGPPFDPAATPTQRGRSLWFVRRGDLSARLPRQLTLLSAHWRDRFGSVVRLIPCRCRAAPRHPSPIPRLGVASRSSSLPFDGDAGRGPKPGRSSSVLRPQRAPPRPTPAGQGRPSRPNLSPPSTIEVASPEPHRPPRRWGSTLFWPRRSLALGNPRRLLGSRA